MTEIWKPIKNFEEFYEISNLGRVKKKERTYTNNLGYIVTFPEVISNGYFDGIKYKYFTLYKDGVRKNIKIHRLVAEAFIPNPENLPQINHKDENPFNNSVENLEWCTAEYNINYGERNKKSSETKLSKGYKWNETQRLSNQKRVRKLDKDLNILEEFDSIISAAKSVNGDPGSIGNCCNRRSKSSYGFVWRFVC